VKDRRPIQFGGLSDQFDGYERKYGKTYELLKFLKEINYPICFSTKAAWVFFNDKYRELFRGADNWNMKFSIITLDEEAARKIEVGVPSPRERLAAMHEYTQLSKGGATLRLRPFIIGVTDKTYLDLIREAAKAGASAVTTEFFCLEMRSVNHAREKYNTISEVCGFDIVDFYRKHSAGSGYLRLNRKIKEPYIRKMQELCKELGLRFYVSDAHFKECSDNCCCCALNPDWNYSRGNFSAALQIAKKTGKVHWKDIEPDMYFLNFNANRATECQIARSSCERMTRFTDMTMKDFLHYLWNDPTQGQSPYKIFAGVLVPDGLDEDKNIIYRYNPGVTFQPTTNMDYDLKKL
jgi:DNA repair photolyase